MSTVVPDTLAPLFEVYKAEVTDANADAAKIKAAQADKTEAVNTILDTSDDPTIAAWREKNAKMQEQIDAALAKQAEIREAAKVHAQTLLPGADPDFNVEEAKEKFRKKRKEITEKRKALLTFLGNDEEAFKAAMEQFGIVEVVSFRGNSTGGRAKGSSNIKRPRITAATVDGNDVSDKNGKVSFTTLANVLGVDGDQLRSAAFAAAGTDDLSTLDPGTVVSFQVTKGDTTHAVTVTAKGRTVKADESAE